MFECHSKVHRGIVYRQSFLLRARIKRILPQDRVEINRKQRKMEA